MTHSAWPLLPSLVALIGAGIAVIVIGIRLTRVADTLADRTGLGDAVGGALLLGAVTSLPGIVTTATGALQSDPGFGLSNPIGGVAIQTVGWPLPTSSTAGPTSSTPRRRWRTSCRRSSSSRCSPSLSWPTPHRVSTWAGSTP